MGSLQTGSGIKGAIVVADTRWDVVYDIIYKNFF